MSCPTVFALFEEYSKVTVEFFEATDNLANLVGQHEDFARFKAIAADAHAKCRRARAALDQHWKEHGCRADWNK
jgi:hypothetical protein